MKLKFNASQIETDIYLLKPQRSHNITIIFIVLTMLSWNYFSHSIKCTFSLPSYTPLLFSVQWGQSPDLFPLLCINITEKEKIASKGLDFMHSDYTINRICG